MKTKMILTMWWLALNLAVAERISPLPPGNITNAGYLTVGMICVTNQISQNSFAITNELDGSLIGADGKYLIKPCRRQLSARIEGVLVTNWTLTSTESPVRNQPAPGIMTLEYRATGYHESGVILSNTVAQVQWQGREIPVVLESVQIATTNRVTWK